MKKMLFYTLITILIATLLAPLCSFADDSKEQEDAEEAVAAFKYAKAFADLFDNVYPYCYQDKNGNYSKREEVEYRNWYESEGYLSENILVTTVDQTVMYSFGERMTSYAAWKAEAGRFFTESGLEQSWLKPLFETKEGSVELYEKDGRTYGHGSGNRRTNAVVWSTVKAELTSDATVMITFNVTDGYGIELPDPMTVEMKKSGDTWQVNGGNFFLEGYGMSTPATPQTGDSTPVFLALAVISLAALIVGAVAYGKKQ